MSPKRQGKSKSNRPASTPTVVRIIGGHHRGRQLVYSGDKVTRPMKDDVRESLFNLVGGWMPDRWVVDLFAGTGAVGLEAVSRGAAHATLIERHFPTAKIIKENVSILDVGDQVDVHTSDAFFWSRQFAKNPNPPVDVPWAIFCCPPWPMLVHDRDKMMDLVQLWYDLLPEDSLLILEAPDSFHPRNLPNPEQWRVRDYSPARVCVFRPMGENNAAKVPDEYLQWLQRQEEAIAEAEANRRMESEG